MRTGPRAWRRVSWRFWPCGQYRALAGDFTPPGLLSTAMNQVDFRTSSRSLKNRMAPRNARLTLLAKMMTASRDKPDQRDEGHGRLIGEEPDRFQLHSAGCSTNVGLSFSRAPAGRSNRKRNGVPRTPANNATATP